MYKHLFIYSFFPPGCGGPGLVGVHVVYSEAGWMSDLSDTAQVDGAAVSMSIAYSLKTCNICGIVLCVNTAHFQSGLLAWAAKGTPVQ